MKDLNLDVQSLEEVAEVLYAAAQEYYSGNDSTWDQVAEILEAAAAEIEALES